MIAVAGLGARVGAFALHDISFEVPSGAYGVVIGPTGSGKTTLLEAIAGIAPQSDGTVSLCGRDVTNDAPDTRCIGLVYQLGFLFPHLSVEENVHYGARDRALAATVARRFGADQLYAQPVRSLSGGERQLVAIVRALARRPEVLLLDEPFSALDPTRRAAARREVRAIHREWGLTTLHVTHDFAEAGSLGDVAILLLILVQIGLGLSTIPVALAKMSSGCEALPLMWWAQSIATLRPTAAAGYIAGMPLIFKLHIVNGLAIVLVFPFTRLVNIWSVPVWFLSRRHNAPKHQASPVG